MINEREILSTIKMIKSENLDVRTITMGLSLRDCVHSDYKTSCDKIIKKMRPTRARRAAGESLRSRTHQVRRKKSLGVEQ